MKDTFLLFLFLKFRNKKFEIKNNNPIKFNFYILHKQIYKKIDCKIGVYRNFLL